MVLTINISNFTMTVGFYESQTVRRVSQVSIQKTMTIDDFAIKLQAVACLYGVDAAPCGAILSSVSPQLTETVSLALEKLWQIRLYVVGPGLKTGLNIKINDPSQLGADLVCMAAGIVARYPLPALLVHLGDVTTLSYIDEKKCFAGTVICPGLRGLMDSIVENADLLTPVSFRAPAHLIGTDTEESIQSGVVYGMASLLDGMKERIAAEREIRTVVATGGMAPAVLPYCHTQMLHDPTLLTDGMYCIYLRQKAASGKI